MRSSKRNSELWIAFGFMMPAAILVSVLMYWPMVDTFRESLFASSFINPTPEYVGFETYRRILADPVFWQILRNSVVWTMGVVLLQNVVGFFIALLLNQQLPGQGILRSLVLLPWVLPGVVVAILWRFMYDPQLGLVNSFLMRFGAIDRGIGWLAEPSIAMAAVIFVAFWKGFPFSTVIFLAALQNVDKEQIEAAKVDGAGPVRRLIDVVIPAIAPVAAVNVLLTTILTFNYFDIIYVLTRGGPLNKTAIFPTRIYEVGFGQFRFGEAAAYGTISVLVLVLVVASLMMFRFFGYKEVRS
ncbi:carbohydrate ABC transporter permease [Oricola indica]|jgi:multiple sugar transport system permease protein|uniref:carbohydrate ABC transporter permease n=1 Tax=Oricola indica TaxID=2872591 RepID=UPI001CBBED89|nr:sugar ABC transporter permease [Oricola indica]